jgi:HEPN domain-containing protein
MDLQKLIDYWRLGSQEDLETAVILLEKKKLRESLFFLHLSLEKALKARVVEATQDHAPKIHNLLRLAEIVGVEMPVERRAELLEFNEYYMSGRYPDDGIAKPEVGEVSTEFKRTEELVAWLLQR